MRCRAAALTVVLAACGGASAGTEGDGTTPAEGGEALGVEAIAELDEPPPPGAASVLSTLEPARLDPTDAEQMDQVAGASAPRVFFVGMIPLLAIGEDRDEGGEPRTCPARVKAEGVTVYRGGCVDDEGTRWTGSAVIRGMNEEQRTGDITYRGFGFERPVQCPDGERRGVWRANGRFVVEEGGYTIDVAFEGGGVDEDCDEMEGTGAVQYEGSTSHTGSATRWNGSGRYGWKGLGVVEATTEDELINQRNCRHEALMGETTVRGAEHTVTYLYDGAEDCDEESTVSWSFDGQPQGELAGVACAAGGGDVPARAWWLAAVVPVALLSRSSRGRPCRSGPSA